MNLEEELVFLCKETMNILYAFKEKDIISEEELKLHLTKKKKFIKEFDDKYKRTWKELLGLRRINNLFWYILSYSIHELKIVFYCKNHYCRVYTYLLVIYNIR